MTIQWVETNEWGWRFLDYQLIAAPLTGAACLFNQADLKPLTSMGNEWIIVDGIGIRCDNAGAAVSPLIFGMGPTVVGLTYLGGVVMPATTIYNAAVTTDLNFPVRVGAGWYVAALWTASAAPGDGVFISVWGHWPPKLDLLPPPPQSVILEGVKSFGRPKGY